jgi:hypothetical protein
LDLAQYTGKFPTQRSKSQVAPIGTGDDDDVDRPGEHPSILPEPFTNLPFHAVSHNRLPDFPTDRDAQSRPQARLWIAIPRDEHHEVLRFIAFTPPGYPPEITRMEQVLRFPKAARSGRHDYFEPTVTASFLRPFARRRLITARPAFDFIRARKPWARFRFRRLG